jgi:hypothetical protein
MLMDHEKVADAMEEGKKVKGGTACIEDLKAVIYLQRTF